MWNDSRIRGLNTLFQTMSGEVMIMIQHITGPSSQKNHILTVSLSHAVAELLKRVYSLTGSDHCWLSVGKTQRVMVQELWRHPG
jgi:hypothetical protein